MKRADREPGRAPRGANLRRRAVNILVAVHSDLGFWNLPEQQVRAAPGRFSRARDCPCRPGGRRLRTHRRRGRRPGIHAEAGAVRRGAAAALDPQPRRRRRWDAVPGSGRLAGRPHQFPRARRHDDRRARDRRHAGDVPRACRCSWRGQQARHWAQADAFGPPGPRTIAGARVLVVGLGCHRDAVARRFAALDAAVTGIRRSGPRADDPPGDRDRAAGSPPGSPARRRRRGHCCSADAETRGLIEARALAAMRADALLVNVSRGKIVDEAALVSRADKRDDRRRGARRVRARAASAGQSALGDAERPHHAAHGWFPCGRTGTT